MSLEIYVAKGNLLEIGLGQTLGWECEPAGIVLWGYCGSHLTKLERDGMDCTVPLMSYQNYLFVVNYNDGAMVAISWNE